MAGKIFSARCCVNLSIISGLTSVRGYLFNFLHTDLWLHGTGYPASTNRDFVAEISYTYGMETLAQQFEMKDVCGT